MRFSLNSRPWLLAIGLASGVFLVHYAYVDGGAENWVPATFPFPGAGLKVEDRFTLSSGGQFTLEVETPPQGMPSATGLRDVGSRRVSCELHVLVTGSQGFRYEGSVRRFQGGGQRPGADLYYPEGTIQFPGRGDYTIEIASQAPAEAFGQSGGVLRLIRFEPVGRELGYPLAKGLAFGLFFIVGAVQFLGGTRTEPRAPGGAKKRLLDP